MIQVDWIGALSAGMLFLILHGWLAELYRLPRELVLGIAGVNLAYGMVSLTLWRRSQGGVVRGLGKMGLANMAWGLCCLVQVVVWMESASVLGLMHFVSEGFYVGGLGWLEWRAAKALGSK